MLSSLRKAGRLNGLGVNRHVTAIRQLSTQPQPQQNERMTDSRPARHSPSFVQNIFLGRLETSQVFPYPMSIDEEQRESFKPLLEATENFFVNVNDARKNDRDGKVDPEVLDKLWELGAFGVAAPEKYGGLGLNASQTGRLAEPSGMNDLSISTMFGAHQSIGYKGILLYGTEEQKMKYLPQVTSGKVMAAFALTEPSAGSDAANIKARAVKTSDGKHYILNGSKIWITNGGTADIMTVFARTEVIDARGIKKDKLTAFIVERGFGGVSNGPAEKKLGIHASNTTEVFFEDCKIPVENVLGKEGEGFKIAVNTLNNGRFGMGMNMGGTMRMCIQRATDHVTQRMTFGSKLETYGGIQEKIARFAMLQYVNQSIAYMLSGNMDLGSSDYQLEAAISKVFASESAWYVCDETIQIFGGMGYMADAGLERFLRDLRIFRIFEGANDTLRLFVALTGMQYAGSHLREVQKALQNPAMNLGTIFKEASKRAGSYVGLGGVDMTSYVDPSLRTSAKQASECIDMFGRAISSLLMKYGKNVIHQQFHLNRIADAAIDIHAMTATLSRATRSMKLKVSSVDHEKLMTEAWCVDASNRVRNNLRQIHSSESNENFKRMIQISKNICDAKDVVQQHPIDV